MITLAQIQEIAAHVRESGVNESTVLVLRQQYQIIHFTYCMDDDLANNTPVLEDNAFNLYLIDGRNHCLCLTTDYELATGVVVAEIIAD
jgi:hypothetical protein